MKQTTSYFNPWKLAAIAGLLIASAPLAQAENLTLKLKRDLRVSTRSIPVEQRRLPAIKRVELGLTPYIYESRSSALHRHDELSSHVLAVHTRRIAGRLGLYPGHSLAPNYALLVSR